VKKLTCIRRSDPGELSDLQFGAWAEGRACRYLKKNGYRILARNFRTPAGEIDIIAAAGRPELKVTGDKQRRIASAGKAYIGRRGLQNVPARFDVVAIRITSSGQTLIDHEENAFEAR